MSTTYKCPGCDVLWKIVPTVGADLDVLVYCPVCTPPERTLFPLTFEDCCPEPKDAA